MHCTCLPVGVFLVVLPLSVFANNQSDNLEIVEVIGSTPLDLGTDLNRQPYFSQTLSTEQLKHNTGYSIADLLDKQAASVYTNDAQNNFLQPDVRYRGYTASPLLGASQGLVVYYNGVRVNEAFGDTVNWDLLPSASAHEVTLLGGANALFGQNALGGALVIEGRDGFNQSGGGLETVAGSFGRRSGIIQHGDNNGIWGYYLAAEHLVDDGWRDYSPSNASNVYGAFSYRSAFSRADLYVNLADTRMQGNGASPEALLAQRRQAVFTHPDRTENQLAMVNLRGSHWMSQHAKLSANIFYRQSKTNAFGGDGSDNETCEAPFAEYLCVDDDNDTVDSSVDDDNPFLRDQYGNRVSSAYNAINNLSERDQHTWGFAAQYASQFDIAEVTHHVIAGGDYLAGETDFTSSVEFAALTETRSTTRSGLYDSDGGNRLNAATDMAAVFLSDTLVLTERLRLMLTLRYNQIKVAAEDFTGDRPELTATHYFRRLNGGTGLHYAADNGLSYYAGVYQSSRAPSPVELACSHPDAPCNLPNTYLADPPLKEVVSRNIEAGIRGRFSLGNWHAGVFYTRNRDDIHFQTTGGVSSNQGYFANIGDTVFHGAELTLSYAAKPWSTSVNYTFLNATYDDEFVAFSPNHPGTETGAMAVAKGAFLPLTPRHSFKWQVGYQWHERLQVAADVIGNSGIYLRGDEANLDEPTAGFAVVNLSAEFQVSETLRTSIHVDNLFDQQFERFGLYGEADEVLEGLDSESNRFLGPAPPRSLYWLLSWQW